MKRNIFLCLFWRWGPQVWKCDLWWWKYLKKERKSHWRIRLWIHERCRSRESSQTRKTTYASVCESRTKQTRKKVTGVTRQWTEVTRTSTDCQTTFSDVWYNLENFWEKSLNGHATVVGGHATVGWLSKNVFYTFQAIWKNFEKSRWTVTRQGSGVTRPSADCRTTFFRRFEPLGKILKKVAELSRDSGRRSRDRRPTVKQRLLTFQPGYLRIANPSTTCPGESLTYLWSFNSVSWKLFERMSN